MARVITFVVAILATGGSQRREPGFAREQPFVTRPFRPVSDGRWLGNGIAYGMHRDGQFPGGPSPTREELREDLRLLAQYWHLLRVYQSVGPSEMLLDLIREDKIDMKVMLGVWIAVEERRDDSGAVLERFPDAKEANEREAATAIRLAMKFPDIVIAVCVGSETQVFWSAHRSPPDILIGYIRKVRAGTGVPVAVADDFNFWNKPESHTVARELDFIVLHAHPLWNGLQLEEALDWTRSTFADIQREHPHHLIVQGETGWATMRHTKGEQARLIKGEVGEEQQKVFYDAVTAWAEAQRIPLFFFEAFDENWKGGDHPDEVEKHWGLFHADRTPKRALSQ